MFQYHILKHIQIGRFLSDFMTHVIACNESEKVFMDNCGIARSICTCWNACEDCKSFWKQNYYYLEDSKSIYFVLVRIFSKVFFCFSQQSRVCHATVNFNCWIKCSHLMPNGIASSIVQKFGSGAQWHTWKETCASYAIDECSVLFYGSNF